MVEMSRGRGGRRGNQSAVLAMFKHTKAFSSSNVRSDLQPGQAMCLYPPLDVRRLSSLRQSRDHEYMVDCHMDHINRMQKSPFFINLTPDKVERMRYSERARASKEDNHKTLHINPKLLPAELTWSKSKTKDAPGRTPISDVDVTAIIARLEQTDVPIAEDESSVIPKENSAPGDANAVAASSDEEEEEVATKMVGVEDFGEDDEDNDYVQSYFDNGETYAYEDDLVGANDDPYD